MTQTQALTPARDAALEVLSSPEALNEKLEFWRQRYHVLSPATVFGGALGDRIVITASVVQLDTRVDPETGRGYDTYFDGGMMRKGPGTDVNHDEAERAPNKVGLNRIAQCAGLRWTDRCGRVDDRRVPYLWEYRAEGEILLPTGEWRTEPGTIEIDLRDGSPQIGGFTPEAWDLLVQENRKARDTKQRWHINGWSDKRVLQARRFGLALAETKAKARVMRSLLQLQQVYTVRDLKKPFLVLHAVYQPDQSDPETRRMVMERALHGRRSLYMHPGQPTPLPSVADVPTVGEDPTESGGSLMDPLPASTPATTPTPSRERSPDDFPDPRRERRAERAQPVGLFITSVRELTMRNAQQQPVTYWLIADSNGEEYRTSDRSVGELAQRLRREHAPVELMCERTEHGVVLVELSASKDARTF